MWKIDKNIILLGVITSVCICLSWLFFRKVDDSTQIVFDLTQPQALSQWTFLANLAKVQGTVDEQGIHIQPTDPSETYVLYSPALSNDDIKWESHPYVSLQFASSKTNRLGYLLWNIRDDFTNREYFPIVIPAGTTSLLFNTRNSMPWDLWWPWDGPIRQFGLQLSDPITLHKITLHSFLPLEGYLHLILHEFFTVVPFKAQSINGHYGVSVLGISLVIICGVPLCFLAFLYLIRCGRATRTIFVVGCAIAFCIVDTQFFYSLMDHARYGASISAWRFDQYEEHVSRFSESFADLAKVLEQKVPSGSKVFFPMGANHVLGESNWIAFQFYPRYHSVRLEEAEYVFYYFPKHYEYVTESGILRDKRGTKSFTKVELLYNRAVEAKILKVTKRD